MDFPQTTDQQFLAVSSVLTAFSETELQATGMAGTYWQTLVSVVGAAYAGDFLSQCAAAFAKSKTPEDLETQFRALIMKDAKCGPLAQNVISMWYLGQWNQLPPAWHDEFGTVFNDQTFIVSPDAYVQSLVWPAFGTHPQGAKGPGFGSWVEPPLVRPNTDAPTP